MARRSYHVHEMHAKASRLSDRYTVSRGTKFGMQNAMFSISYMVFMNKFSSIMIIDGRKKSSTHGVNHVMS